MRQENRSKVDNKTKKTIDTWIEIGRENKKR